MWLPLALGRLRIRLHFGVVVAAAAFVALGGDLWVRYLLLLATLLLHELGHAVAAVASGGRAEVRVWPVFGMARVDRPTALVALAGPLANALAALALLLLGGGFDLRLGVARIADLLFTANLLLAAGNLIPVPPLDGGRALRALRAPS